MTMSEPDSSGHDSPVVARYVLGANIAKFRGDRPHKVFLREVAEATGVAENTVRRWQAGAFPPRKGLLTLILNHFDVTGDYRDLLYDLRDQAEKPGYWEALGEWSDAMAQLLGMEMVAYLLETYDLATIPGLLQTGEYARLVMEALSPSPLAPSELERGVELRIERQRRVWKGGHIQRAEVIIHETAFATMPGNAAVRHAQVASLLRAPEQAVVRVMPFSAGPPAATGSFTICRLDSEDFPGGVHASGATADRSFVALGKEVDRHTRIHDALKAKAYTPEQTAEFLSRQLERIDDDAD